MTKYDALIGKAKARVNFNLRCIEAMFDGKWRQLNAYTGKKEIPPQKHREEATRLYWQGSPWKHNGLPLERVFLDFEWPLWWANHISETPNIIAWEAFVTNMLTIEEWEWRRIWSRQALRRGMVESDDRGLLTFGNYVFHTSDNAYIFLGGRTRQLRDDIGPYCIARELGMFA